MLSYCLNCRKKAESRNPQVTPREKGGIMFLSKYAVRNSIKSRFIKRQKPSRLLSSLGLKTPLSEISLFGDNLF